MLGAALQAGNFYIGDLLVAAHDTGQGWRT